MRVEEEEEEEEDEEDESKIALGMMRRVEGWGKKGKG